MNYDLTLNQIKNIKSFSPLYQQFITRKPLSAKQYEVILALAICFINADAENVKRLGYRIIVEYCNQSNNYAPLYEIAINKGLYPVSRFIEKHLIRDEEKNFFTEWNDAFTQQFVKNNICLSEQQDSLTKFFENKKDKTISIIAPTSYGKSELIIKAVQEYEGRKICILTSTKALLIQTKKRIQNECKGLFKKIVVHPEMYDSNDPSCLAVLTQERLLRIFKKDPSLAFDCIIIDEAHEMLENDGRSKILADVIMVAKHRNSDVIFKFLTPFLSDSNSLKTKYVTYDIEGFKVNEYIKTEKYFLYDLRSNKGLILYDQFLNRSFPVSNYKNITSEEDVIKKFSASKNIIYFNKPKDIENFALKLANVLPDIHSEAVQNVCKNISDYLQPQYNLLKCLQKGIIYHHGSVPDAIRNYIEDLYKKDNAVRYLITSSTLLSGVNLPAERMFILDNKRGTSYLRHDSFMNLVGRVCRFNEIFNDETGNLHPLEPQIYIVFGNYFAKRANCEKFLKKVAKVDQKFSDKIDNVLLEGTFINDKNQTDLRQASEFLENYENGIIKEYKDRRVNTDSGKKCIMNGVNEFDIFTNEGAIQQQVDLCLNENVKINDTNMLLEKIHELFIQYIPEKDKDNLSRLKNIEARKYYSMMLDWRVQNKSYSEMIQLVVKYWQTLYRDDITVKIYVGKWGDIKSQNSNIPRYTRILGKTKAQIVNLAIVRIKEEQDFIDNNLIKFVEVLYDLDLIEPNFYSQIKYGTNDENTICLIKNGLSLSAATLLIKKYKKYLKIDTNSSTVTYNDNLISKMNEEGENEIQIYEIQNCM